MTATASSTPRRASRYGESRSADRRVHLTVYEDRQIVLMASNLLRRSQKIEYIEIFGYRFYPRKDLAKMVQRVAERRSVDWVNEVASKYNVSYAYQ